MSGVIFEVPRLTYLDLEEDLFSSKQGLGKFIYQLQVGLGKIAKGSLVSSHRDYSHSAA